MKPKFTMILMLLALSVQMVFAQQKTVSGTVSDENGLPLPGATVIRAGTSSGTSTDFDGKYQLAANDGDEQQTRVFLGRQLIANINFQ